MTIGLLILRVNLDIFQAMLVLSFQSVEVQLFVEITADGFTLGFGPGLGS